MKELGIKKCCFLIFKKEGDSFYSVFSIPLCCLKCWRLCLQYFKTFCHKLYKYDRINWIKKIKLRRKRNEEAKKEGSEDYFLHKVWREELIYISIWLYTLWLAICCWGKKALWLLSWPTDILNYKEVLF